MEKAVANNKISRSKFELSLAEFPLFLLSKGGKGKSSEIKVIEYEDTINGKNGLTIPRKWTVYPDPQAGFGTASTFETLFDLFQIRKEQKFEEQSIRFGSIYNLLKRRNLATGNRQYKQILRDLNCLVKISIEAKNAFWDNEIKAYVDITFHLFDRLELYKEKPDGQANLPLSMIKASDVLYGSIQKNSLLTTGFDKEFFYDLTPIEQRLALYLSKIFRSQYIHKRNLNIFAGQIPIYAKQTKHVKEQLKKGCNGLIKKGFDLLEEFYFEKAEDKRTEHIVFKRRGRPAKIPKLPGKEQYEVDVLVEDILDVCKDKSSINFYKKVARLLDRETIYRALAEVREVANLGEIKKSKGALFTNLIKKYAAEQKIEI